MEAAWAVGPFLFCGEYTQMVFSDLASAGNNPSDAEVSAWYASVVWHLTGERSILSAGRITPLYPHRFFNPQEGTWGALSLAARLEHFSGDEAWITPDAYVSVAEADAFSLALNWTLFPMARVVLDFIQTRLSDPIRVRVLPDGDGIANGVIEASGALAVDATATATSTDDGGSSSGCFITTLFGL